MPLRRTARTLGILRSDSFFMPSHQIACMFSPALELSTHMSLIRDFLPHGYFMKKAFGTPNNTTDIWKKDRLVLYNSLNSINHRIIDGSYACDRLCFPPSSYSSEGSSAIKCLTEDKTAYKLVIPYLLQLYSPLTLL